MAKVGF